MSLNYLSVFSVLYEVLLNVICFLILLNVGIFLQLNPIISFELADVCEPSALGAPTCKNEPCLLRGNVR